MIGTIMQLQSDAGNGFPEVIYQRSLWIQSGYAGLYSDGDLNMKLIREVKKLGERRADTFMEKENDGGAESNY